MAQAGGAGACYQLAPQRLTGAVRRLAFVVFERNDLLRDELPRLVAQFPDFRGEGKVHGVQSLQFLRTAGGRCSAFHQGIHDHCAITGGPHHDGVEVDRRDDCHVLR